MPSRADLARSLRRLVATDTIMQGAADHGVSEALYLADEDGNGIEIYRDRPRDEWPMVGGQLRMGADPLDLDALLAEAGARGQRRRPAAGHGDRSRAPARVATRRGAARSTSDVLGFELTQRYGPSALFVAAGGYHHHIGLNTWAGVGAPPPPPGAIGLKHFVVVLPDAAGARRGRRARLRAAGIAPEAVDGGLLVHDPAKNAILLTTHG